jgi:hypothetical protein
MRARTKPWYLQELSRKERQQQTQLIMKLFELWKLTTKQQAILIGTSPNTETGIYNYKNNKNYLPINRDTQDRIRLLLTIHQHLRKAYPFNKELAYQWMTTRNMDFAHLSPVDVIAEEGIMGLVRIKRYLELNAAI